MRFSAKGYITGVACWKVKKTHLSPCHLFFNEFWPNARNGWVNCFWRNTHAEIQALIFMSTMSGSDKKLFKFVGVWLKKINSEIQASRHILSSLVFLKHGFWKMTHPRLEKTLYPWKMTISNPENYWQNNQANPQIKLKKRYLKLQCVSNHASLVNSKPYQVSFFFV